MARTIDTIKMQQGREPIAQEFKNLLGVINQYYGLNDAEIDMLTTGFYGGLIKVIDSRRKESWQQFRRDYKRKFN